MSSSWRVFSVDDSALPNAIKLNDLPVDEKQSLSTAEISAPTARGKLLLTCCSFIEWRTTDCAQRQGGVRGCNCEGQEKGCAWMVGGRAHTLRSPCCSDAPSRATNFFAWTARVEKGECVSKLLVGRGVWQIQGALLTDRLERLRRRRPGALGLLEAQVVERGADRDDDVARERRALRLRRERVALGEGGGLRLHLGDGGAEVGGGGVERGGANGHGDKERGLRVCR